MTKPECATCLKRNSAGPAPLTVKKDAEEKEDQPDNVIELPVRIDKIITQHHCKNCGAVIEYGQPLYQGHDYWYHVHNHSPFCTLPTVAAPSD